MDSAGNYVVAGTSRNGSNSEIALTRYTSAGVLDTTFGGGDGIVTTPVGPRFATSISVAVDSAGNYVAAGSSSNGSNSDFTLVRYLGGGTLSVSLTAGDLAIADTDATGKNNNLTVSRSGANLLITDSAEQFSSAPGGGTLSNGNRTLSIPWDSITGAITFNTAAGNDTLTIDLSGGDAIPAGNVTFNGGDPATANADQLRLVGGTPDAVTYNAVDVRSGNITLASYGTVSYFALESLTLNATSTEMTFKPSASPNTFALGDDGISGNGLSRLSGNNVCTLDFRSPEGSLTINRGSLSDVLTVNTLPDTNANINLGAANAPIYQIAINGFVTLAADKSFAAFAANQLQTQFSGGVKASGSGGIQMNSARFMQIRGAGLTVVDGPLTVSSNEQAVPSADPRDGIDIDTVIQATGAGVVTIFGRGGESGGHGLDILPGARIIGGSTGITTITGIGRGSAFYVGVFLDGTPISTLGSSLVLNGASNCGTGLEISNSSLVVGGAGSLTLNGSGLDVAVASGIALYATNIASPGGNVTLSGSGVFFGVLISSNTQISASGGGRVDVTGTTTVATNNLAVAVFSNSRIASESGAVTIIADNVTTSASFSAALILDAGSLGIVTSSGGTITIIADSMSLDGPVVAPGGTVILRSQTTAIQLGAADDVNSLGLTDAEMDKVTAETLKIGDATSPAITIRAPITRALATKLQLSSAAAINFAGGSLSSAGGSVTLNPGTSFGPATTGVDVNTGGGTLTIEGAVAVALNGPIVDTQYTQLNVNGTVNLTGASLSLSGTYSPLGFQPFVLISNDGADAVVGTFIGLPEGAVIANVLGSAKSAVVSYRGGDGNDVTLTIQPTTQWVSYFASTATGARFLLSNPVVIAPLNLYDFRDPGAAFVLGASDVQLTNLAGQSIPGSLVIDATGTQFTFVATAGRLPADTYTLTLRSAANGFRTAQGDLLDGNGDGTTGDNFTATFTVAAPPANAVTVSLPHFARGPEQPVNVPTTSTLGLPINVSDGANLTSMQFDLAYDVGLLAVTNVALVGGGTATLTPLGAGQVRVALTFSTPLSAGPRTVAYLSASVPSAAASRYGERGVLDISNILVTAQGGGSVPGLDQDAVQINTYFGDVGRNGRYDSFDVQQTSRLALDLDTGFQQHPLTDPVLLADFNGNGRIDSFDTQRVSRLALNLPVTEAADLPNPLPTVTDTDRVVAADPSKLAALRSDVDANGSVDAQDVLWAVYYFGESANGTPPTASELKRLDINTDGLFDPADILLMVTDLAPKSANVEGGSTAVVAQQSDAVGEEEDLDALAYLLAADSLTTKKKGRG